MKSILAWVLALLVAVGVCLGARRQAIQALERLPGPVVDEIPVWRCAAETSGLGTCSLSWPKLSGELTRIQVKQAASCFFVSPAPRNDGPAICTASRQACEVLRANQQRRPEVESVTACETIDLFDLLWRRACSGFLAIAIAVGGIILGLVWFVPVVRFNLQRRRRWRNVDRWQ
jgi:hypothetical protein